MPRNPRADQIGTGGRIKSESPGGCARNAQLRDGRFSPDGDTQKQACFLPVEIIADVRHEDAPPVVAGGRIEFDLAGGHRLCVSGTYDPDALARLIRGLSA